MNSHLPVKESLNKFRKGVVCQIPERCLWWIAKVEGTGDDLVLNRILTAWIDESEEQDMKVLSRTLRSASAPPEPEVFTRQEMEVCQAM